MNKTGVAGFPYYVGIKSLAQVATPGDTICVLNILGTESREVTPVSHAYSGGNVVFGTSPGHKGEVLVTKAGSIPVFDSVREGLDAGHRFNTGVVYLPPSGVRDGVAELIRVNPELQKIVILTEKVSIHDAREIRAFAQSNGVDVFGANCLGVADSWNQIRIGGALGGDHPEESLIKGSVAIYSNSGNFTTTIAQYLATGGWGTTTLISSGKDVYIHFAADEFANALANDDRSRAAVMYIEPGGYYEQNLSLTKPVVACVVGRWKSKLTRAVGHAGAMGGAGDNAESKERWLMEAFDVDEIFTPENPVASARGAVVINIAHIPLALNKVAELNGFAPDFPPTGDLTLKPWLGNNQGLDLPPEVDLPIAQAMAPYDLQIAHLRAQIGAVVPRQSMRDSSGATRMDPATQITSVHGYSVLDLALLPFEVNLALPLIHETMPERDRALLHIAVAAEANLVDDPALAAADAARAAGNAPNLVLAAAACMIGPARVEPALQAVDRLIDLFGASGLQDPYDDSFDLGRIPVDDQTRALFLVGGQAPSARAEAMLAAVDAHGGRSVFLAFVQSLDGHVSQDGVLAAIAATIAWGPLMRKRISRLTAATLPWYLRLYGVMIGATFSGPRHRPGSLADIPEAELLEHTTLAELAFLALTGKKPDDGEERSLEMLVGLLVSNGPGAISAQGAKGAVSADGPQTPERVQVNKAMVGFLTHTGFAHGGNGFEGMAFLLDRFAAVDVGDPTDRNHGLDLRAMAMSYAREYKQQKAHAKELGASGPPALPGVHHPVFKGKPVNHDPREQFVAATMAERDEYNIFHDYFRELVQALADVGASPYVFCINVDGMIAALLLALLWPDYQAGRITEQELETAAFTVFLLGRMMGAAAEIDDHLNRGRNMDTRTPASRCKFVT
jgi:succinyl-CoA synthetase alpha subunit